MCFILVFTLPGCADVAGPLRVIDGDTFDVGKTRVRLHGVDAPENDQTCTTEHGVDWACGAWVSDHVRQRLQGVWAKCTQLDTDRYGRVVASCTVQNRDLGEMLVSDGLALAYRKYSNDYLLAEKSAAIADRGLWGSEFQTPAQHRIASIQGRDAPDKNCAIKGNISQSGKIYHMPHNRDYARTGISPQKGERWFCSEAQAVAAGWRAARN